MEKNRNLAALLLLGLSALSPAFAADNAQIARGRYLVKTSGCNDCHTAGYREAQGRIPEADWLTGNPVGFKGPWGVTYPPNLRILVQDITEAQWMEAATSDARPPMPWYNLAAMKERDLKAIYQFIRHLGPKGEPAPDFTAPDEAVTAPYIEFVPKNPPK